MKRNKLIIIFVGLAIILLVIALILFKKNKELSDSKITIIDASYQCNNIREKFYEDDKYVYLFPCVQSSSTYVKFANGNKMLVINALQEDKVGIDDLIKAGLNVIKEEK